MKNKLLLFGYVFAASFGAFVVGLNLGGISGALEFITAEFGLSAMAMGLVTSAIMIGCLIGALLGGRYSDKYGRRMKCTPNIGRISICLDGMSSVLYRAHVV